MTEAFNVTIGDLDGFRQAELNGIRGHDNFDIDFKVSEVAQGFEVRNRCSDARCTVSEKQR